MKALYTFLGSSELCQCGCRGWCSWYPILLALAWDLKSCANGIVPNADEYENRIERLAGQLMFVLAILEIRADWPAWAEFVGIRTWAHHTFPCPKCDMRLHRCIDSTIQGSIRRGSLPWTPYTHDDYLGDIKRHSIDVLLVAQFAYLIKHVEKCIPGKEIASPRNILRSFPGPSP